LSAQAEAMDHAVRKLSRLVDSKAEIAVKRPAQAKRIAPSARPQRASPGVHALRSAVSSPPSRTPVPVAETPTDAQFLESFEEM